MKNVLSEFFKNNNLNINNEKFVIAVSTGVDSTVLLDLFIKSDLINNDNIIVCHVNHHKRVESDVEEKYIIEYCKNNNIKLYVKDLYFEEEKENFQSLARQKRYEFFNEVLDNNNAKYLVLAHHADDLIETILLRIMRGSSLRGYAGINNCYLVDNHYVIRPLLNSSKDEIYEYAKDNNLKYFEDSSNNSDYYTRNKLRHSVIPSLKEISPDVLNKFYEYSKIIYNASDVINTLRDEFINKFVFKDDSVISFSKSKFLELNEYMQEEVLFELVKPDNLSKANINELLKIIRNDKSNFNLIFKNKFEFIIEYDKIIINYDFEKESNNVNIIINDLGLYKVNDNLKITVSELNELEINNLNELWYNKDNLPITIRNRINGDKILINNSYKKVKDILIDLKIPKKTRDNLLLAVDKNGEVLAIFGVRKSSILKNNKDNNIVIKINN